MTVKPLEPAESPLVGRACRVHLRRDALGMAANLPLGLANENIASRAAVLAGTVEQVSADWVVLRAADRTYWLPRSMVLAIETTDAH